MKLRRLHLLVAVMAILLGLRWWTPPVQKHEVEVVPAVARSAASAPSAALQVKIGEDLDSSGGTRDIEANAPRNPFAVRQPNQLAAAALLPSPTMVGVAPPAVGLPSQLPPPATQPTEPPPFQVVGSWRDDRGVSVFVVSPSGLQQARTGDVIADYRFLRVTSSQVQLKHLLSSRDVVLPVPVDAESTFLTEP